MVTSRDVQDIVSKLSSDKAKAREDGIKLLNTWLEGERQIEFCKYLGQNTAKLKPNDIPNSDTWPFLITLLIQCVSLEISSSKRRLPKVNFAKTLRIVVQRAGDAKISGNMLPLLPVVKMLFNHLWDVLSNVPSFQSEYGVILRHLLSVKDYRFHLRNRVYCSLMRLYIEKVETSIEGKSHSQGNLKEETFRSVLTLHSLLENPPGDFSNELREDIVNGFVRIFSIVREEGKFSRKLIECINVLLLKDGPNLGSQSMDIHNAVQHFVFRCWLTTHDQGLKDALVFYARLQLNLTRGAVDGSCLVEQILDVICRELDQNSLPSLIVPWPEASKDDKFGTLSGSQCGLVELAALVFYKACLNTSKPQLTEKRAKREHVSVLLKEALLKGKWLWNAMFCCLIRNYYSRMNKDLFIYWFEGISTSFERILSDSNVARTYDSLLWTLRSLQELSTSLLISCSQVEITNKLDCGWQLIWSCFTHALPLFSNQTAIADAGLVLLGCIISRDLINTFAVPQEFWDLKVFKQMPSRSVLYFIACYFSHKGSQGDPQESLHLRKNLLTTVLGYLSWKESFTLNEDIVVLLPAAVYSLCTGCAPFAHRYRVIPLSNTFGDNIEASDCCGKTDEHENEKPSELFECSVEVLATIELGSEVETSSDQNQNVRLPLQLRNPLLHEMDSLILGALEDKQIEKRPLSDILFTCALIFNFIHGSLVTTARKMETPFLSKICQDLSELLNYAVNVVKQSGSDFQNLGCSGSTSDCNLKNTLLASFKSLVNCSLFVKREGKSALNDIFYNAVIQSMLELVQALAKLYEQFSECSKSSRSESTQFDSSNDSSQKQSTRDSNRSRIMDMELDVIEDLKDVDIFSSGVRTTAGISFSTVKWKLEMLSLISSFSTVVDFITWDILLEILKKECDTEVCEDVLCYLCQHPCGLSFTKIVDLVETMNDMMEIRGSAKLDCVGILAAARWLLRKLLSLDAAQNNVIRSSSGSEYDLGFKHLKDLITKVAEFGLIDWKGRVQLIGCICDFVLLNPQAGQTMIEKLILLLQDPDYRVRFSLAQHIGVLFETWDGHEDLFQDICLNLGVDLVLHSKGKIVTAKEVLKAGPQPLPKTETSIITLMHVALHSEKVELEAIFTILVVAAIDPCHRELVNAVLDNLSSRLQYASRFKYLEELIGTILFFWVTCGVSLVALVEIRNLLVLDAEPSYFMQYCCQWLLPALVLRGDKSNLNWVAKTACQTLPALVKNHFVPIFSVCMALHCSKSPGAQEGALVLQTSILDLADISENERDHLIKKHMVSIVSHILSLSSCSSDPAVPLFSRDVVARAVQTVVDGFLEVENHPSSVVVMDKINIFRPDRVFMFMVEMHYKIAAAAHPRHRCHKLAGLEVLIDIIGHRTSVPSTSNYALNLVGQFIGCQALQDQCCRIISALLSVLKDNRSREGIRVLGEQLQFLVSKLVACCVPSDTTMAASSTRSSAVLPLLLQLTLNSDQSLHDYVRELEPFPEMDFFSDIRKFHQELCESYSPRDHLLKFVKRSCYLPPRLLLCSFQALHKKLFMGEILRRQMNTKYFVEEIDWHGDPEIVKAVWMLVRMCGSDDASSIRPLVADFVSRVGMGDPYRVIFHMFERSTHFNLCGHTASDSPTEISINMDIIIPEELLISLMKLLKKYLMDDSVRIVDLTSQTLRGLLSTERGQRVLLSFDAYERSLMEVHSKGINVELVEKFLVDIERRFRAQAISLEESSVWETTNKTFDKWICPLVYSLIGCSNDVILRLFQDIVLLKAEVAELLLPSVIVDLARGNNMNNDVQKLISIQAKEHILTESNKLIKSIQLFLNALNELRICYVLERSSSVPSKKDSNKHAKPSSYGSRSRSSSTKVKDFAATSSALSATTLSWEKVYWLDIDYLIIAKSAVICGSYFTSMMYVEYWCEENFNAITLGRPDFSHFEMPGHVEVLVSAVTLINEPDSLYGIIQSHKLTSQVVTFEHEGNWSKALEYYDLQVRSSSMLQSYSGTRPLPTEHKQIPSGLSMYASLDDMKQRIPYKGLVRSLQQIGCTHVLDLYCQGLTSRKGLFQHDSEFMELQYEAAWRAGNWDFSSLNMGGNSAFSCQNVKTEHFNENLHSCLKALKEGDADEFHRKLIDSKQDLVISVSCASEESTEYIHSSIIKLQMLYQLGISWQIRWTNPCERTAFFPDRQQNLSDPVLPTVDQLTWLNTNWSSILEQTQLHMNLIEPFIAFRRVLLQILGCYECSVKHLLQSTSTLRKGSRFSQAAAALHEFKLLCCGTDEQQLSSYWLGRLEEAKLFRAQGQHEMAISLAKYISQNCRSNEEAADVYRLVGKWLAETRSSNSRTILEKYLKPAVSLVEDHKSTDKKFIERQSQAHFNLAHYADALFRSYEDRLTSSEWQAALRLRKHKTMELEALLKRLRSSEKGDKIDCSAKIQELQKQLTMDKEEAEKLQDDRDNFLSLTLEGYKRCLVIGDKYDVRVVFRLVSLWFNLASRESVINNMLDTVDEVQSYKFVPLVYQIASRLGSSGPHNFQFALASLVKKMAIDHPYHTIFQLLALENGGRVKDKQRSRNSFVVDKDKILAARTLLAEVSSYHGEAMKQMRQMVDIYIKLAELETKKEDMNKKLALPREIRSVRQLELVPVVTASFPVDRSCNYNSGSFPFFKGLADSVMIMNGINAPKVVECLGSDGKRYRQLAKSGNDDLRQDAVMEQFFGLVNTFLRNNRDTCKRKLNVRTYKVVPFTPSAGVLEWVNGTIPLGEYLIGSMRNGGAHGRYGIGDWPFPKCREYMLNAKDKRKAFKEVCENFRPVMHHFFLERFLRPADWFEKRLAYTRSVAASSMVGYIVGLGDRHSMNILIDQTTAEVVHIDLGVAFEQGLMLKTPERVPFRLTRDIIDGMGVTGVEGVFRRCCEETLSVMRTNKEALLTIVEVFIHDPLYKWALSPLKALQRQEETDDADSSYEGTEDQNEGNKDAARALMRVKQKLDGYEEGELRSVHGQVQQLIQDATDSDRLCQMFPGWGAWM